MVMFRGLNAIALDTKGRIAVPSRYRSLIQEIADGQMVVTIDTDQPCLLLYPFPTWQKIEKKLDALPSFDPAARRIQRLLIGHATEVEMDKAGRLLLPPLLREYGGFEKTVMCVGQGSKFEIWGEAQWQLGRDSWLAEDRGQQPISEQLSTLSL